MKSISIFALLIYWSIIILAPVLSRELKISEEQVFLTPKIKPSK